MKNKIEIKNEEELYPRIDAWHYLKDELPEVSTDIVYAEHHVDMPYVDYYECIEIDKEDIKNFYAEGDRRDMWAYTRRNIKEDDLWRKENVNFSLAQANNPNWREYEEERNECVRLISKLDDYYDKNGIRCKCSRIDIYIYLFSRNGMIPELKKYYKMEDTTDEEFDELIRESDIYSISKSIDDIRMIAEMDKIFKENIKKRGKRLKY